MKKNKINLILVLVIAAGIGIACARDSADKTIDKEEPSNELPRHLDSYEIKGFKFAYYLIPKDLGKEELLKTANDLHKKSPDSQLLLLDDDSQVDAYIKYVKSISGGGEPTELPAEWADKHIIANVQKYMNGRWVLCKGNGYEEIADLDSSE